MNHCPPKILVILLAVAIVGSTIVVVVQQSRPPRKKVVQPASELPAAISNYSKTFKLNTNPPLWTPPANGRNATN